MTTLTLRQIADRYAAADGLGGDAAASLHARLRGVSQRGLFHPVQMRGKAAEYDFPTVAAVRLMMVCADLGLDQFALRPMAAALNEPLRIDRRAGAVPSRIAEAARRAEAGETFTFKVELFRDPETGEARPAHSFSFEEEAKSPRAEKALAGYYGEPLATLTLPASDLIASILAPEGQ